MTKKLIDILITVAMLLCLASCSSTSMPNSDTNLLGNNTSTKNKGNKTDEEEWVLVSKIKFEGKTKTEDIQYFYDDQGRKIRTDENNLLGSPSSTICQYIFNDDNKLLHCYEYELEFLKENKEFFEFRNSDYTGYTYSPKGEILSKSTGLGNNLRFYEYTYNNNGNVLSENYYKKGTLAQAITYEYNGKSLISKCVKEGSTETISIYDKNGNLVTVESKTDDSDTYSIENYKNGIISNSESKTSYYTLHKEYDSKGNIVSSVYSNGGRQDWERKYDKNDNIIYEKAVFSGYTGDNEGLNGTETHEATYDDQGHQLSFVNTIHNGNYDGVYATRYTEYGEDGHSYVRKYTYDYNYAEGVTPPVITEEYNYLPLKKCLEQQEKDLIGTYKQTDIDTGAELFVGKTLVADCCLGVMMYKNDDGSFYRDFWLIYNGEYYFMNNRGETHYYEIKDWAKGSFEFENGNIVISNYNDTSGYHQFSGHY